MSSFSLRIGLPCILPELAAWCHCELTAALPPDIHPPLPLFCLPFSLSLQSKVIACSTFQSLMQIKLQPVNHYSPPQHQRFRESPTPDVDTGWLMAARVLAAAAGHRAYRHSGEPWRLNMLTLGGCSCVRGNILISHYSSTSLIHKSLPEVLVESTLKE